MRICAIHLPALRDVQGELARLAEIALCFGATVAFEQGERASHGNVVWVDITGCAHLYGPNQAQGEQALATHLANAMVEQGHACAVVCADGPRVAAILAHELARQDTAACAQSLTKIGIVPPGKNAEAMALINISALPLPESDVRWLHKLGVRSVGDLTSLPRASLASRLGARAAVVLALAEGDDRAPLTPYVPPSIPEEEVPFEYGVTDTEALVFVTKTLTDRLASRLESRAVATSRLELVLSLDRALLEDASKHEEIIVLDLPSPLSRASDLLSALRPKLEQLSAESRLRAPVLSAKLRAPLLVHKPQSALSLFDPLPKAARVLPRLVAELAADLGLLAVGKLALGDAWQPKDRSRFVPVGQGEPHGRKRMLSSVPEPTRMLDRPIAMPRSGMRIVRLLTRLESVEWWRAPRPRATSVDYVYAWVEQAPAWVEIDRASGLSRIRGWFD
ncbi:MAG: hypothetical protein FWD73_09515 [Polyangiaceae bacterium]|nr:hypothetical protein [Polyangiaceae bacterium]